MDTTLIVCSFIEGSRGVAPDEFYELLTENDNFIKSSSEEFKRQLVKFGIEVENDEKLIERITGALDEENIEITNRKLTLEKIVACDVIPSEENLYKLCFALKLNAEQTQTLFQKAFGLRGFNLRVINDIVYCHCLTRGKSHQAAVDFIQRCYEQFDAVEAPAQDEAKPLEFLDTVQFAAGANVALEELDWTDENEVFEWIKTNRRELVGYSRTAALKYIELMYELRFAMLCDQLTRGSVEDDASYKRLIAGIKKHVREMRTEKDNSNFDDEFADALEAFVRTISEATSAEERTEAWDGIRTALEEAIERRAQLRAERYSGKHDYALSEEAFDDTYEDAVAKHEFMKALLPTKKLFWELFSPSEFSKADRPLSGDEEQNRRQRREVHDQIPGLANFMVPSVWAKIDADPRLLTLRQRATKTKENVEEVVFNPLSALEWARADVVGRKILIIIFFYRYVVESVAYSHVPKGAYNTIYDGLARLLKDCGFPPLYERNYFDCVIIRSVIDFGENYSDKPKEFFLGDDFLNEVLGNNYLAVIEEWREAEEQGRPRNREITPEIPL